MATVGTGRGVNARRRDLGERCGVDAEHHLGQQVGEAVLQRHRPRIAAQRGGLQLGEHLGDVLERPVLQQPGEQQVAHLQQREVLLVVHLAGRQQPGRLEVEQRRGDHQERGRLVELQLPADRLGVGDEVVGHLVQRHLGDVEAVREDQLQQQVERTLEVGQPDLEAGLLRLRRLRLACSRAEPVDDLAGQRPIGLGASRISAPTW